MKIAIAPGLLPKKMGKPVEPDSNCAIGQAIRILREGAGMTQVEMAKVLDVERTSVTNMENGKQVVALNKLEALATFLGAELRISFHLSTGESGD